MYSPCLVAFTSAPNTFFTLFLSFTTIHVPLPHSLLTDLFPFYSDTLQVKLPILTNWSAKYSIQTVLETLLQEMASPANRSTKQPPEGANY